MGQTYKISASAPEKDRLRFDAIVSQPFQKIPHLCTSIVTRSVCDTFSDSTNSNSVFSPGNTRFGGLLSLAGSQGPEEMCLSLEHQNPLKTSDKMGY